ncbi:alkaline ceramidase [Lepeophtheirus salmonis]|nr:alkaline ceramidase-like [Lepeophtheirus salmonis]XP_040568247.1 alkaline ceramidase-like [Lepeophtheirus salmonis]
MWLRRGSSPVDWCETNYTFSPFIAEFFNTISNVLFILFTPVLIQLHKPYASIMGPGIHIIWALLFVVGLSSAYFHATLSLLGQLLDEVAILWVVMAGFGMWFPKSFMPGWIVETRGRKNFLVLVFCATLMSTVLGFIAPSLNAFFLMTMNMPASAFLIYNLRKEKESRIQNLGKRSIGFWLIAIFCWVNDRVLCDIWISIQFPYLHGFWHIFIFIASYSSVVLFAYFDVKNNYPLKEPSVKYWPSDSFELGIPYVQLRADSPGSYFKDPSI